MKLKSIKKRVKRRKKTDLVFQGFIVMVAELVLSTVTGTSQLFHKVYNSAVANAKHLHSVKP